VISAYSIWGSGVKTWGKKKLWLSTSLYSKNSQKPRTNSEQLTGSSPKASIPVFLPGYIAEDTHRPILIFNSTNSEPIEIDFRGTMDEVIDRIQIISKMTPETTSASAEEPTKKPGRPKLGVVSKEITLLPRHWEWLKNQPGGASVTLRKLVEEARRTNPSKDTIRTSQEFTYRFLASVAGDLPQYEEATRVLFASEAKVFNDLIENWPSDIRKHAQKLSKDAFAQSPPNPQR
jgi:hypothetical protein